MLDRGTTFARLIQGTVFVAALAFAPCAFAQENSHYGYGYRSERAYDDSYRLHHRHHQVAANGTSRRYAGFHSRHHHGYLRAAYSPHSRSEIAYEQRHDRRARMIEANEVVRGRAADARERPITAELNLIQLPRERERAAAMARWQLQYGAAARG